ncbi:MAG: cssS [Haloplasmataceae bacterium]|jgi:two-component system sensor histidine kinase CssS|nr:cssS [Haloplasmataceae bacterium]
MKFNKSIKSTVAIKFFIILIIIALIFYIIIPLGIKNYFVEEAYRTIEISQEGFNRNQKMTFDPRTVNHITLTKQNNTFEFDIMAFDTQLDTDFITQSFKQISIQKAKKQRYLYEDEDKSIYYVISKNEDQVIISFVSSTYVDHYISTLYGQFNVIFTSVFIISLILALFISNNITKPLISISKKIKNISNNNWDEEIPITRQDEIGHIESSLEELRKSLKSKERIQQEMFQNISHDLKTPIMIIEGYSQLVIDGYVQSEELNETMGSIMEEAKRLEKKVKSLLYINKIDQLYSEKKVFSEVDVEELFNTVITPYKKQFGKINFEIELKNNDLISGLFDEWRVALENIIDNMTRFANKVIRVTYQEEAITIFNDGEHIDESKINLIFDPYGVGNRGNFGLGLAISKKIVNTFGYEICAKNISDGVIFEITKIYKNIE